MPLTTQPMSSSFDPSMTTSLSFSPSHPSPSWPSTSASAVAVKAPMFTEKAPLAWFKILEAQFHLANITKNETKFYHALASLPPDLVAQLSTDVLNQADYDELRSSVCEHHETSKPELIDRFLASTTMTGRPSHYLAEMRRLASQIGVNEDLIRHKFQHAMPPLIAPILATQRTISLDDLGRLADELIALNPFQDRVSSISPKSHSVQSRFTSVTATSPPSLQGLQPFSPNQKQKVCRWHIFFGGEAKKCRPWCQWPNKLPCTILDSRTSSRASSPTAPEN